MLVADKRGYTTAARQKGKFGIEDLKGFGLMLLFIPPGSRRN